MGAMGVHWHDYVPERERMTNSPWPLGHRGTLRATRVSHPTQCVLCNKAHEAWRPGMRPGHKGGL